jgi:hypothetical protein
MGPTAGRFGAAARLADGLAVVLLGLALAFVLATFPDYGITIDEWVNHAYGRLMLDFWRSLGADERAFHYQDLRYYGPWFQTLVAAAAAVLPFPEYDTRHLVGGLVGWLTLAVAWRVGRDALGPAGGLAVVWLLAMTGYFVGNAFNNPIDLPFAFAAALYLLALNRYAAAIAAGGGSAAAIGGRAAAVGIALGFAVATRAGGGVLVLSLALLQGWLLLRPPAVTTRAILARRFVTDAVLIGALALAVAYALWPWLWPDPAGRLMEALGRFSRMPLDFSFRAFGVEVRTTDLPAWYLPGSIAARLPLVFLAGVAALPLVLALAGRRQRPAAGDGEGLALWNAATLALVPLAVAVLAGTTLYDGFRHVLFVLVPLAVLAAAAMVRLARRWPWTAPVLVVLLVLDAAATVPTLVRLHPYQYIWFNRLVGGPAGAAGRFELDYGFAAASEAAARLIDRLVAEDGPAILDRPLKVGFCMLGRDAQVLLPPAWQAYRPVEGADFAIQFERNFCPWADAYPAIAGVERLGIPLATVRDLRNR